MKAFRVIVPIVIFHFLGLMARAESLSLNAFLTVNFDCTVQQGQSTNNFKIDTGALMKMIARDQGFSLPAHAEIYVLGVDDVAIMNPDHTVIVEVDTNILSMTGFDDIYSAKTTFDPNHYKSKIDGIKMMTLNYNGATTSFTMNFYGKYAFDNETKGTNAFVVTTYSAAGFGPGTSNGQYMIVTGDFDAKRTFQYTIGGGSNPLGGLPLQPQPPSGPSGIGAFPGSPGTNNPLGAFPGNN